MQQVETEIIAYESSGFQSQNFESSLEPPSSDSSESDDSTDDFACFIERPISPPMAAFRGSDSFVEDTYNDSRKYGTNKIQNIS